MARTDPDSVGTAKAPGVRMLAYGAAGDRPPLLAIPGIDGSPGSVAQLIERLAGRRRVVLADYRTERNDTLDQLAAEVIDAASGLPTPVDVLGQSIGTVLAARLASRRVEAVRRVVLIGAFTRGRWTALRVSAAAARASPSWLYRLTAPSVLAVACGPVGDGRDHPFFTHAAESDPKAAARRTAWQVGRDFTADFASVPQPTLVLMGADDRFVPRVHEEIARLRRLFAGADDRVVTIPGTGHVLLPSHAVDRAMAEIDGFLA